MQTDTKKKNSHFETTFLATYANSECAFVFFTMN